MSSKNCLSDEIGLNTRLIFYFLKNGSKNCSKLHLVVDVATSCSYLVCLMYEEAATLASSILKRLCEDKDNKGVEAGEDAGFHDMLESTGMVLVQSLKGLGRYL